MVMSSALTTVLGHRCDHERLRVRLIVDAATVCEGALMPQLVSRPLRRLAR
jgi:hypothetical protein